MAGSSPFTATAVVLTDDAGGRIVGVHVDDICGWEDVQK